MPERDIASTWEYDLPPLEGTEKQVDWARSIRAEVIVYLDRARARTSKSIARRRESFETGTTIIMSKTSAKWWIDEGRERIVLVTLDEVALWAMDLGEAASKAARTTTPEARNSH